MGGLVEIEKRTERQRGRDGKVRSRRMSSRAAGGYHTARGGGEGFASGKRVEGGVSVCSSGVD